VPEATRSKHLTIERSRGAVVAGVRMEGLDDRELKLLRESIDACAREPGVSVVVVDLSRVPIFGSKELGALIQMFNGCRSRHQKMKLAAPQPRVRGILSIAHLDQLMEITDTVEAALE